MRLEQAIDFKQHFFDSYPDLLPSCKIPLTDKSNNFER